MLVADRGEGLNEVCSRHKKLTKTGKLVVLPAVESRRTNANRIVPEQDAQVMAEM